MLLIVAFIPATHKSDSVIHVYSFFNVLSHYGLSQDIEYSSLCYILSCLSSFTLTYFCNHLFQPPGHFFFCWGLCSLLNEQILFCVHLCLVLFVCLDST